MSKQEALRRFLPADPRVEEPYRVTPQMAVRLAVLGALAILLFSVLFFRLWALQVIAGDRYLEEARSNQFRTFAIQAPRGAILDRHGRVLVSNVPGEVVQLWPAAVAELSPERRQRLLRRLARLLSLPLAEIEAKLDPRRLDPLTPVPLKLAVREDKVAYLLEHQAEFPGVQIAHTYLRHYEHDGLTAHVLGYVGPITARQLAARRDKGYELGDEIGQSGVEVSYDEYLRGQSGLGQVRVDAFGRVTGERQFSQLPVAGEALRLTVDARLQRVAEQALRRAIQRAHAAGDYYANGGAIVAMDPWTGELYALASSPSYDPSIYVGRRDPRKLARLADPQSNSPGFDRATAGQYPPGSAFKLVTAIAALEEGLLSPSEQILCSPQRVIDNQLFHNWNPNTNEPMTLVRALAVSCDTYFYDVAIRFYHQQGSPLQRWARRLGFGRLTGLDIGPEAEGLVPDPAWRRRTFDTALGRNWSSGNSVQLAIGQGDLLVTPLQLTRFYALIANGGKLVQPHVMRQIEESGEGKEPTVLRLFVAKPPQEVGISDSVLRIVREGLWDASHAPYGTSFGVFGSYDVPIVGKTGTAEKYVPAAGRYLDQAWWCGYGPFDQPRLVVCALVENGGHGGAVAAPAALEVFEAYFGVKAPAPVARVSD